MNVISTYNYGCSLLLTLLGDGRVSILNMKEPCLPNPSFITYEFGLNYLKYFYLIATCRQKHPP